MSGKTSPGDATAVRVRSIQWRILARQLPLITLIFAGLLFWLGRHLTEILYSSNLELARSSAMEVVYLVQASMLSEGDHRVWDRVFEKIPRREGSEIEIINTLGEVLAASDPAMRTLTHQLSDPSCVSCHEDATMQPSGATSFFTDPQDKKYQVLVAPLNNTENCRGCHSKDGNKLGVVLVRQSLEPIGEQVRSVQVALTAVGGITLLLTMLTFRLLVGRYLGRPLKRLVAGAKAIGEGDLAYTIKLPERTELAVLADTLNASTARLSEMQDELVEKERLAATGGAVAGLAHCLKNLLNGLRAGQYIIDGAIDKQNFGKLGTGWRIMKKSVRQVERLMFDMLYYAEERVPDRKPVNPNEIIVEVIESLKEVAAGQGVELRAELDEGIGEETLDHTAIYRAIVDLVTNAVESCTESESGDSVTARSRATRDEIVLTVEDNGVGMSEELLVKVFTRFFSTKETTGTGLSLSVVKKIAEEHGGKLEVESAPGKGSTFHIRLPRTQTTVQPQRNGRPQAPEQAL